MQSSATAKTKWAPKHGRLVLAATIALAALFLVGLGWWLVRPVEYSLKAGDKHYVVDVANDIQGRKKGLSGRADMPNDHGMLFVFPEAGTRCIWMKDMRFSLDVIWLDGQKRVIDIQENMTPETYPHSFCPSKPAQYVVELNAGQVEAAGIEQGQTISF